MVRQSLACLLIVIFLSTITACGGGGGGAYSTPKDVSGAAQKGPFLQGSSVLVNILDNNGLASDLTIVSQTDDSLGNFNFTTHHKGPVQIVTTGYYFNEISGVLSDGPLTLRGIFNISSNGEQTAYVNILTHLINNRVLQLIGENKHLTPDEAIFLAQGELQSALTSLFNNDVINDFGNLSVYDVEGSDTTNNGYLLAISATFCQAAMDLAIANSSSVTSELTLLLSNFADDLAQDGVIDSNLVVGHLQTAITKLDATDIEQNLVNYSESILNTTLPAPDISGFLPAEQPQPPACGDSSLSFPEFTSDLEIIALNPDSAQSNVPTDTSIHIQLSKEPETYSWGPNDMLITDSNNNVVEYTPDHLNPATVVLNPVFPLQPDSCYTVRLDTGLIFNADEKLTQPFGWSFSTGSYANVSINSHQNGDIISDNIQLSGTFIDSVAQVEVEIKVSPYPTGYALLTPGNDWTYSFDSTQFSDGGIKIVIEGLDQHGASTGTTELNLIIDNTSGVNDWAPQPLGTSNSHLFGIGGSGNSVLAVGENTTVLEFDGSQWNKLTLPWSMEPHLYGVWGLSSDDYYIAGGGSFTTGAIMHNKSNQWANEKSGAFRKVWGTSTDNVYALGSGGVFHFDGTGWSPVDVGYTSYHFYSIWGTGPNDVYIAAFSGPTDLILHYDGTTWTNMLDGSGFSSLFTHEIWGTASDNIYAVGTGKQILHFDGTAWTSIDTGLELLPLYGVWGYGPDDIYVIGASYPSRSIIYHYDGSTWSEDKVLDGVSLYDIWGSTGTGVFAVGGMGQDRQGVIYHLP